MAHKYINTLDLINSNEHWRFVQRVMSLNTKRFCFGKKKVIGGNTNDRFSHLVFACMRELIRTRVMGMRSLISFMTCNVPW